jgi:predicted RNA-binding Zn ribbon-like protein
MNTALQNQPFELIAGHPVLDLVNTLDWRFRESGPEELIRSYADLLRFTEESGLLTPKQARQLKQAASGSAGARVVAACKELREAAAGVFYATLDGSRPANAHIRALECFFKEARANQKLHWKESQLIWGWPETDPELELPLWVLSLSASELMTSDGRTISDELLRVRECERPECRWLFLDTSKNHTRRWCDMKVCGNRTKAQRFRAQRKTAAANRTSR